MDSYHEKRNKRGIMGDISNTSTKISKETYLNMYSRYAAYKKDHGQEPGIIYTQPNNQGDFIQLAQFNDMRLRFDSWWKEHGQQPAYVVVKSTTNDGKSSLRIALENAVGTYNTFTEFYNRLKGRRYSYYYNDIYNQSVAIQRLKNRSGLNCADSVQISYAAARDLGYTARYVHVVCKSGTGHIQLDVKGGEFGSNWKRVDPAAALSSSYNLGNLWCSNGSVQSYNDGWLLSDDGKT